MITADEDVKMEDKLLMLYSSQSLVSFFSSSIMHSMPLLVYTLIAVIILRYSTIAIDIGDSTGTVIYAQTTSGLGPKLAIRHWFMVQCVSAMRVPLSLPGNAA